jgi:hypothetical protein
MQIDRTKPIETAHTYIYKYHFPGINQDRKAQMYSFWVLIWPFKWVLGVFTVIPMCWSIHPFLFAQAPINHELPAT